MRGAGAPSALVPQESPGAALWGSGKAGVQAAILCFGTATSSLGPASTWGQGTRSPDGGALPPRSKRVEERLRRSWSQHVSGKILPNACARSHLHYAYAGEACVRGGSAGALRNPSPWGRAMKKLRLDLDTLGVETFATDPELEQLDAAFLQPISRGAASNSAPPPAYPDRPTSSARGKGPPVRGPFPRRRSSPPVTSFPGARRSDDFGRVLA